MIMQKQYYGTGRRKRAIARVFITQKSGFLVNKQPLKEYFVKESLHAIVQQPLKLLEISNIGLYVTVKGGGCSAQSQAIRHGLARALVQYENNFRGKLRQAGFLTRDARKVERKKVGFKKARRRPQFSKR